MRRFTAIVTESVTIYFEKGVSRASAALSYFLMLSIFPTLVCLYAMLGSMFPTSESISSFVSGIIPQSTIETILDFLGYVTRNQSRNMVTMAIAAMVMTSAAAFRTIDQVMGEIRGRTRFTGLFAIGFSFIFSLIFLAAIYFSAIVIISGRWLVEFISEHISYFRVSATWNWSRFLLLFLLIFVINIGLYRITAPKGLHVRVVTGAFIATAAFVGASILFSFFIGMSVKYPLVYGSLASVMILLFWLYICGNIVILGNVINVAIERVDQRS